MASTAPCFGAILEEGSVTLNSGTSDVGNSNGEGSLWITPPSILTGFTLRIATGGGNQPFNGSVYVQGGAINMQQDVLVGDGGRAKLEVTAGGIVDAARMTLAGPSFTSQPGSEATMTLDGVGTKARVDQFITVGESGFAEAFITGGALLQSGTQTFGPQAIIANRAGSVGNVALDGQATAWQHGGPIIVGNMGTGSLHATGGANVSSSGAVLGDGSEGTVLGFGSAVLEGEGTRWITTNLTIGDRGVGEMRVSDGALLEVTNQQQFGTVLGDQQGSFGQLIISDPGTRWVDSRPAMIGDAGVGELWIEGGAIVVNAGASLGQSFTTGSGLAVVRGAHTRWHAGGLVVGVEGRAQLRIEDGATVAFGSQSSLEVPRTGTLGRLTLSNGTLSGGFNQSFENRGVIEGHGLISITNLNNVQSGQVLVGAEERLQLSGNLNTTQTGRIEIIHGELEIGGFFTNGSAGRVIGEGGTLRMRGNGDFINFGLATFLDEGNRVIGDTVNNGSITAAGNSELTFHNDVQNLDTMKASAGATITVLGTFSGNGVTGPGTVFLEGPVAPGTSPGAMNFGGDVTLGDLSELTIEVAGAVPGIEHDQFNVAGTLDLSGGLNLAALDRLNQGATLTIITAGELGGSFASIPELGADIGYGVRFNGVTYDYENDAVTVSLLPSPPLPGDFDHNGAVDGADFLAWQQQLGVTPDPVGAGADGNADGAVDGADLAIWQQGFTENGPSLGAAQSAVPEPSAAALIFVGLLGFGGRRVGGGRALRL